MGKWRSVNPVEWESRLCSFWVKNNEKICFPYSSLKSRPTHSVTSPPHLTTGALTPLYSRWAGGRKLVKWHPPVHLEIPQNRQQLTTGRLATTPPGDFPTGGLADWQTSKRACKHTSELQRLQVNSARLRGNFLKPLKKWISAEKHNLSQIITRRKIYSWLIGNAIKWSGTALVKTKYYQLSIRELEVSTCNKLSCIFQTMGWTAFIETMILGLLGRYLWIQSPSVKPLTDHMWPTFCCL